MASTEKTPNPELYFVGPVRSPPPVSPSPVSSIEVPAPKRQRRQQGSSESDEPLPDLEHSEIWNEDFRSGGPTLVQLPADNEHPLTHDPLRISWDNELQGPTRDILEQFNVTVLAIEPVRRTHTSAARGRKWHDTILISATKLHATDTSWYHASQKMRQLFLSKGYPSLNVEIIDDRADEPILSFPILSSEPFVQTWSTLRPKVLNTLEESDWTALSVLRRGKPRDEQIITISIAVKEDSVHDWTYIAKRLEALLDAEKLPDVAIDIFTASIFQAFLDYQCLTERDLELPAKLGGSLGRLGSAASSSTFGGFLELELADGEVKRMGVTNFHCVIGNGENEKWEKYGLLATDPARKPQLEHPSLGDVRRSIEEYQKDLEELKARATESIATKIEQGDPSVSKGQKILYERQKSSIDQLERLILKAEILTKEGETYLGDVYAGSGFRVTQTSQLLDWALVDVQEDRIADNNLPQHDDIPVKIRSFYAPDPVMKGVAALDEDMDVFKQGKHTGFTRGQLNGIHLADIQSWHQDSDGKWDKVKGTVYHIIPVDPTIFADPGDSGSFVINKLGQFVGLYVGGNQRYGTGFFISAEDIFDDIKLITGAKRVSVP